MAEQEFLASFGVQIDESGLNRLQLALQQNRELAEALAAAFDKARASVEAFFRDLSERSFTGFDFSPAARVTEEQQGLNIPFSLDFTKATKELAAFFRAAGKALSLNADASGIIAAGQGAFSQLQSLYASRVLRLQAEVTVPEVSVGGSGESNGNSESSGSGESGTSESSSGSTGESSGTSKVAKPAEATQTVLQSATGGRFSAPTTTEIAEDGDPEYVIHQEDEGSVRRDHIRENLFRYAAVGVPRDSGRNQPVRLAGNADLYEVCGTGSGGNSQDERQLLHTDEHRNQRPDAGDYQQPAEAGIGKGRN